MRLFVDTWGWMVLANKRDPQFDTVTATARRALEAHGLCATNFVVAETITLMYSRFGGEVGERVLEHLLHMLEFPEVRVEDITRERFRAALDLRRRFHDKPRISFTDLTSMVVMRELGITDVLTADQHFLEVNLGFRLVPGL